MKIFISTSFDNQYVKDKKQKIYATDFNYYNNKFKKNEIIKNEWEDHKILEKDFIKLNKTIEKLENLFSKQLSKLHQNLDHLIFKKIIKVWLVHYVQSYYFKWRVVNKLLKQEKKIQFTKINVNKLINEIIDTKDYLLRLRSSDHYNYHCYFKILEYLKKNNHENIFFNKKKIDFQSKPKKKLLLFGKIYFFLKSYVGKLFLKKKNVFFLESQNKLFFFKLNSFLKQIPFKGIYLFNWNMFKQFHSRENLDTKILNLKNINSKKIKLDQFEKFLVKNFNSELPLCYTKNFKNMKNYLDNININPKIIFTFFGHFYNELFKLWIMLKKKRFKNLYIIEHGGHHQKIRSTNKYEFQIGNKFISWSKMNIKNTLPLPPVNYFKVNTKYKSQKNFLIYIPIQKHKYISRINHGPQSNSQNYSLNNIVTFKKTLHKNIFDNFLFSPKQEIDHSQKKYLENFIDKKNILKPQKLKQLLSDSKLVVCSYPQTAFIDSIIQKPTILVYKKTLWPYRKDFKYVYDLMEENQIIFEDVKKASVHINKIWNNPLSWWFNKDVQKARKKFLKKLNIIDNDERYIKRWTTFINSQIGIKNL